MSDQPPEYPVFDAPTSRKPTKISARALWVIAMMYMLHVAWIAFCALWIPSMFGLEIARRLGSPVFILPVIVLVYALAPFVASFSAFGREYWEMLGRGGSARRATIKLLIVGAVCFALAPVVHHLLITV